MTRKADARSRAQSLFPADRQPRDGFKAEVARAAAAADANTARLRALRLAREEEDRLARLEFEAAWPTAPKTKSRTSP